MTSSAAVQSTPAQSAPKQATPVHIGELAARLGLNPKTIRYYERIGLLLEPERTDSGYRLYGADAAERLRFILKAKTIGLSLEEIGQILSLRDQDRCPCQQVLSLVDAKLAAIEDQLRTLTELHQELVALRDEAGEATCANGSFCSLIEEHRAAGA